MRIAFRHRRRDSIPNQRLPPRLGFSTVSYGHPKAQYLSKTGGLKSYADRILRFSQWQASTLGQLPRSVSHSAMVQRPSSRPPLQAFRRPISTFKLFTQGVKTAPVAFGSMGRTAVTTRDICFSRSQRKEVLHATGKAGKLGQRRPVYTDASKVRC